MPANTPRGLPYPLPTEPVADGAQAIRNLAEAVDARIGALAYVELNATLPVTSLTEAAGNTILTAPSLTAPGGELWRVEVFFPIVATPAVSGGNLILNLWDGSTDLGWLANYKTPAAVSMNGPVFAVRHLTPAAGARVYTVRAWVSPSGSGNVFGGNGGVGAQLPGFLRIVKV